MRGQYQATIDPGDPWAKMAIEKQHRGFLKEEPEPGLPATLAWLEKSREDDLVLSERDKSILDYEITQLHDALRAGKYAIALTEAVWNGEENLKEVMNERLESPTELVNRVIAFSLAQRS